MLEDPQQVARLMMRGRIASRQKHGKWDDQWVVHPQPSLNEPHKAVCLLTARDDLDEDRMADLCLRSGITWIDNVSQKTRRLFSAFERPVGTSSTHNKVWHGYAPYNPAMMEKYLTIFQTVNNFVFMGDDGNTPAMRLGYTKEPPLEFEDILWPGQRVPRSIATRRRGRRRLLHERRPSITAGRGKRKAHRQIRGESLARGLSGAFLPKPKRATP